MKWVRIPIFFNYQKIGKRIDDLEGSIGDLMQEMEAGQEDAGN